jgi:NarL family two-component system response regulator LiaR
MCAKSNVLIVDDDEVVRLSHLRSLTSVSCAAEAVDDGEDALRLMATQKFDVVLLDLRMPGMDGLACLEQIREHHPEIKVVILSASTDPNLIQTALKRGASAFVIKSVNPVDLPSALRQAIEGTVFSAIGQDAAAEAEAIREFGLTERELTILRALSRGLANQAIAKELWLAEQTVKFHLTNIYRKLGVANRTEAARYAYQQGLVESPIYEGEDEEFAT